jgi:hypothetical protein
MVHCLWATGQSRRANPLFEDSRALWAERRSASEDCIVAQRGLGRMKCVGSSAHPDTGPDGDDEMGHIVIVRTSEEKV